MILKHLIATLIFFSALSLTVQAQQGGSCLRNVRVSTWSGLSSIDICQGDGTNDVFRFRTSSQAMLFAYLITDENDIILGISTSQFINLEGYPQGTLRVYAFSYMGSITAQLGQHAFSGNLATICSALTINFVTVNSINPDGGSVAFSNGAASAFSCVNNTEPSILHVQNNSAATAYAYILTNSSSVIIDYTTTSSFDASMLPSGIYRIYGMAFAGNLTITPGNTLSQAPLASLCYGLSDNFLSLEIGLANAGSVTTTGGATTATACQQDLNTPITFSSVAASTASYVYVLTNPNNQVIAILNGNALLPSTLTEGTYRVWGLSFTGNLTLLPGDNITTATLADECADLSDNFVSVLISTVTGGTLTASISDNSAVCIGDANSDIVQVQVQGQLAPLYTFLLIDAATQVILDVNTAGSFDLSQQSPGALQMVGLAHLTPINFQSGLALTNYLGSCTALASNVIPFQLILSDGGSLMLQDSTQSTVLCTGNGIPDLLSFTNTSSSTNSYAYIAVDAAGIVIALSQSGTFDFEGAGNGTINVWGISYHGNLLIQQGSSFSTDPLATSCYQLSQNFVDVQLRKTKGGQISLGDGNTSASLCTGDGHPDLLNFNHNSGFAPNYAFLIVDEQNTILAVSTNGSFDFEGTGAGLVFVRGLAYTGNLNASSGMNILTAMLSDECYHLSQNTISITKRVVDGGTLFNAINTTSYTFCGNDGFPDIAIYNSTTQSQQPAYAYLITDVLNTVILLGEFNDFDFDFFGPGTYRIWGMAYSGNITVQPGDNAANTPLSDACYDLSDNFITITINTTDAGSIAHQQTSTVILACTGDSTPDIAELSSTSTVPPANYVWLVTTTDGQIRDFSAAGNFDFDTFPADVYYIWGLAFSGNLLVQVGMNVFTDVLASNCYGKSQNFIQVRVDEVVGGQVSANNGLTSIATCFGDNLRSDTYTFNTTGSSTHDYVFVVTNEDDIIVNIITGNETQFDDTYRTGRYRIRGIAYVGSLLASVGDQLFNTLVASQCYAISENFILLSSGAPDGGNIKFSNGAPTLVFCPSGNLPDTYELTTDADLSLPYLFIVTDTNNVILALSQDGTIDSLTDFPDAIRVWGLSYTGALLAQPGMALGDTQLATECFSLSTNYRSVFLQTPNAGAVSLIDGSTTVTACISNFAEILDLFNDAGYPGNYIYLITNTAGEVLEIIPTAVHDFSTISENIVRVYGLAYTGDLIVEPGDTLGLTDLSTDCYDISTNFIQINASFANGGALTTLQGETLLQLCAGDGVPDVVSFSVLGASSATYIFLITDEQDFLIGITNQPFFNFENAISGVFRIHGLSYTGIFQLFPGDNIFGPIPASSGCYDFSSSFIEITNSRIDGGHLQANGHQSDVLYICPGDGIPDVIQFINNSDAPDASYGYLFTNELNRVTGFTFQSSFDFNISGIGTTRIWGISFTGNLLVNFGDDVLNTTLSDGCYSLSDNFLTVIRDIPFGGYLTTADFETQVVYCKNVGDPILEVLTSSTSNAAYVFVLTDRFNDILEFSDDGIFDLSNRPQGTYRVWGLSYTGIIQDDVENLFSSDLGNSCLEISGNFIVVEITEPIVGGVVSANQGLTTAYFCPGNGIADVFTFQSSSPTSAARYRFVVTNQNGLVFVPNVMGNTIDFDGAGVGEYRIYGIAFTGNYQVNIGTNILTANLSDSCFQRSSNFIRIISANPDGGSVFALEGVTEINIDTQDGLPDVYPFSNTSSSPLPYLYVLTDDNNTIIQYLDSNVFNFEGMSQAALRLWGLSYFGPKPTITGVPVSSLVTAVNCAELSENFVRINRIPTFTDNPLALLHLSASPNPATDKVNISITASGLEPVKATLFIVDAQGKVRYQGPLDEFSTEYRQELDINDLAPGVYTIKVLAGTASAVTRIIKPAQ